LESRVSFIVLPGCCPVLGLDGVEDPEGGGVAAGVGDVAPGGGEETPEGGR
jgi:hypothetical protein